MASWLVLDWDQDQFHVLYANSARNGVTVTRAASWTHPEPFTPSTADSIGKALHEFLKTEKISAAPVIVGLGRDRVFLKELRFPAIAPHEEAALVRFQTGKEMAESADNYTMDYVHLNGASGDRQVMAVAARRDIVPMIQTMCKSAGLTLHAVTPRVFGVPQALERSVEPSPLSPKMLNVVLNVGERWAELSFFKGDRLLQAQALANGTHLVAEVKRNLAVFKAQFSTSLDLQGPECLYVFGDDPMALQSLQNGQQLPIRVLDPLRPESGAGAKNPGDLAGAVGLAALWTTAVQKPVNLASPKRAQPPTSALRQRGMFYGVTAAVLLIAIVGGMAYMLSEKKARILRLTMEKQEYDSTLQKNLQVRADVDAYRDWEQNNIPWLNEMYNLAANFPIDKDFRLNQMTAGITTSTRKGNKEYVGKISLAGTVPEKRQDLLRQFTQALTGDGHLRVVNKGVIYSKGYGEFKLDIDVARQDSKKYLAVLTVPPEKIEYIQLKAKVDPKKKMPDPDPDTDPDNPDPDADPGEMQ